MPYDKFKFKKFITDEGLDKSKKKSTIRVGWDGRQPEIDHYSELAVRLQELSMKNFEKWENSRATIVALEQLIESNKDSVAKANLIHEQNEELLSENKKINNAMARIAKDIADNHLILTAKDQRIKELEDELARK